MKKIASIFIMIFLCVNIIGCKTTIKDSGDCIGGVVEFNNEDYTHYKIFDEEYDKAKKTQSELSITLSSLKTIKGKMNGKRKDIIALHLVIYNNSDSDEYYIEPDKGFITNKNNKRINASLINSDHVDGAIKPKDLKDVVVVFPLTNEVFDNEKSFKYTIDAVKDKNMNKLGEEFEFNIEIALPIILDSNGNLKVQ